MRRGVVALLASLLCVTSIAAGEIYRWVDAHGKVHYGDRPGRSAAQKVEIAHPTREPTKAIDGQRRQKQQRLLKAFEIERKQKQQKQRRVRKEKQHLERDCARARKELRDIRNARYLYQKGKDGERKIFTDSQRQAATRELEDTIGKHCD